MLRLLPLLYLGLITLAMGAFVYNVKTPVQEFFGSTATDSTAGYDMVATALSMYYMDKGEYPRATNTEELIKALVSQKYLNRTIKPKGFRYETTDGGRSYILKKDE